MSNIYIQEPPTNGKVLLITSVGDIDIELWGKEAPKACRNFIQLCMEHYYDNTIFHRIVKGFCIQGGDPTGTGLGGESVYGHGFKDELHQRLKFNRRGLVAMANSGPNDNRSQFFFTLDRTDELNGKHTIFGKITGNTIYNMLKMVDVEVDENEHPLYPPKIMRTEVLSNPFDDIEPRDFRRRAEKKPEPEKKLKVKGTKNFSLLSFGDEAEGDEEAVSTVTKKMKMKSSHDVLDDPSLSKESAVPHGDQHQKIKSKKHKHSSDESDDSVEQQEEKEFDDKMREEVRQKLKKHKTGKEDSEVQDTNDTSDRSIKLREESKRLQRELVDSRRKKEEDEKRAEKEEKDSRTSVLAEFRAERQDYLTKKKSSIRAKGGGRDEQTYSLLADFEAKLIHAEEEEPEDDTHTTESQHDDDMEDTGWMSHALKCDAQGPNVKDANIQNEDTFEIFDPRNPINQRRREASKQAMKDKKRR